MLDALARALQLDEAERAHLFDLARAANIAAAKPRRPSPQRVRSGVHRALDAITGAPAWVRNGRADVLAANRLGYALYAPVLDDPVRPANTARFTFLNPGPDVSTVKRGDFVIAPFAHSDNTCEFCRQGLHTSCRNGGFWAADAVGGAQAEAIGVPSADGTLVKTPVGEDSALLASLLTLSDVFCTGHHAAVTAGVNPRGSVTVIGDGAVGLSGPRRHARRPSRDGRAPGAEGPRSPLIRPFAEQPTGTGVGNGVHTSGPLGAEGQPHRPGLYELR